MWRLQIKSPALELFYSLLFLFLSHFSPFFFLHARPAISMLKHFSSNSYLSPVALCITESQRIIIIYSEVN